MLPTREELIEIKIHIENKFFSDGFIHNSKIVDSSDISKVIIMLLLQNRSDRHYRLLSEVQKKMFTLWSGRFDSVKANDNRLQGNDLIENHRLFMSEYIKQFFPFTFERPRDGVAFHFVTLDELPHSQPHMDFVESIIYDTSGFPVERSTMNKIFFEFQDLQNYFCYFSHNTHGTDFQIFRNNDLILDKVQRRIRLYDTSIERPLAIGHVFISNALQFYSRVRNLGLNDFFGQSNDGILQIVTTYPDIFYLLNEILWRLLITSTFEGDSIALSREENNILIQTDLEYVLASTNRTRIQQSLSNLIEEFHNNLPDTELYNKARKHPCFNILTTVVLYNTMKKTAQQTPLVHRYVASLRNKCVELCDYIPNNIGFLQHIAKSCMF
jgi:hypothetical protein